MHWPAFQSTGASGKLLKNILIQFHPVPENPRVGSSILSLGTIKINTLRVFFIKQEKFPCGSFTGLACIKTPQHHQLRFSLATITNTISRFNEP
jgi:hypothetical protein